MVKQLGSMSIKLFKASDLKVLPQTIAYNIMVNPAKKCFF
jgi:hypothetical protein